MSLAYIDTSCLVAVAFGEKGSTAVRRALEARERLFASNLLEAELRSACRRESVRWDADLIAAIDWMLPARPLSEELDRVLSAGYARGADAWHLACALHLRNAVGRLEFLSLDARQRSIAAALGMPAPDL